MKEIDLDALVRINVKKLKPYSSARDDFQGSASVFLDANENPFPSSYNRYPDPHQAALRKAIAKINKVSASQVFTGNGSDEVIDLLLRAFCEPGQDKVVIPQPTYGMYSVCAAINNVAVKSPLLTKDFDLDVTEVLNSVSEETKIIFLCSPNNPSGNLLNAERVGEVLSKFSGLVVIDEAYIDFAETPGWVSGLGRFRNLVVMQTFSKAWGLAGLRLGVCFADPAIISFLEKIKPPYNINAYTQSAVLDAIEKEKEQKGMWVVEIRKERERLRKELSGLPGVHKVFPSDANFLLAKVADAKTLYMKLMEKGIIVRDRSSVVRCDDCLRITVGTRKENDLLIEAIQAL